MINQAYEKVVIYFLFVSNYKYNVLWEIITYV